MNLINIRLIGKGGFVREILSDINKHIVSNTVLLNTIILSDLDGSLQKQINLNDTNVKYLNCIGSPINRELLYNKLKLNNFNDDYYIKNYISKKSILLNEASINIGLNSIICAGTILTTDIFIGNNTHINLNCTIGHDVKIGNFVTCSPGVNISGNCIIGNNVLIGSNTSIKENVHIGNNIIIGMGSVVTKNILEPGTYIGNPCKKM
jgi:sugar O-acyltransferase (sialic acid O-acetyltransferase NeuD family)